MNLPKPMEWLLLRAAKERAASRPEAERIALRARLKLARQQGEAAHTLWFSGHRAEALRLARDAFQSTLDAISALRSQTDSIAPARQEFGDEAEYDAEKKPGLVQSQLELLRSWKLEGKSLEAAMESVRSSYQLPRLEEDFGAEHAQLYRYLEDNRLRIDRELVEPASTTKQLQQKSWRRVASLVLLAFSIVVVGIALQYQAPKIEIVASSHFAGASQYAPERLIDGDPSTEWVLDHLKTGHVEISFAPARQITKIDILNGHNPPHADRAARGYRLTVQSESKSEEFSGELPFSTTPEWVQHQVNVEAVSVIRLDVNTFYRSGGAVAELRWSEAAEASVDGE
ncbi:MAG: hypothetical protein AAF355_06620 [Myxococcota bacterium]